MAYINVMTVEDEAMVDNLTCQPPDIDNTSMSPHDYLFD